MSPRTSVDAGGAMDVYKCNTLHVENRSKYVEISRNIHENMYKYTNKY